MTYFITLKTFHAQVVKQDQLKELMNNPNARVAVGKKGKALTKKLMAKQEVAQADEEAPAPKESVATDSLTDLILAAKAKKAVAKAQMDAQDSKSELLLSGYKAP